MITIIVGISALIIGYWFGRVAQKDIDYKADPDNDSNLSDDDSTMLLFTKSQRYSLGRAMVIGDKEEVKKAKEELERAISTIMHSSIENMVEPQKQSE